MQTRAGALHLWVRANELRTGGSLLRVQWFSKLPIGLLPFNSWLPLLPISTWRWVLSSSRQAGFPCLPSLYCILSTQYAIALKHYFYDFLCLFCINSKNIKHIRYRKPSKYSSPCSIVGARHSFSFELAAGFPATGRNLCLTGEVRGCKRSGGFAGNRLQGAQATEDGRKLLEARRGRSPKRRALCVDGSSVSANRIECPAG